MLKGIDPLIGPPLLHALASMGHSDQLALVDANYPAYASGKPVFRLDGIDIMTAARAIFSLIPVDSAIECPVERMEIDGAPHAVTESQREFRSLLSAMSGRDIQMSSSERTAFYEHARGVYAIVATGETRPYSCFIVSKGTIPDASEVKSRDLD